MPASHEDDDGEALGVSCPIDLDAANRGLPRRAADPGRTPTAGVAAFRDVDPSGCDSGILADTSGSADLRLLDETFGGRGSVGRCRTS